MTNILSLYSVIKFAGLAGLDTQQLVQCAALSVAAAVESGQERFTAARQ